MTVHVADSDFVLHVGDALQVLRTLPAESVHCCVTSPPYWGLRDYGMPGQLGLEPSPEEYVANMVSVFAEVRRVLRRDGTCWLNIGDNYASGTGRGYPRDYMDGGAVTDSRMMNDTPRFDIKAAGYKPKDLCGIPWRLAFALQADGWYLRSDIVWSKPNPMPESVTDRPTKAHEFLFLLTKGEWKGPPKGRFCDLSESDKRWLALLVDAEGNICVKRVASKEGKSPQYGAQVAIGSTSRALLERVQQITGCGNVNERQGTNAPMFYWQASNKVARDLLYAIYPHLIVKPRQARIAMHLESLLYHRGNATMRTERENAALESLWARNKDCNQFGDPDLSDVPEPRYGRWGPTKYFYDADAIREPHHPDGRAVTQHPGPGVASIQERSRGDRWPGAGRNRRSVWEIPTEPYPDAHFATFPQALVEPCVKAGCPEDGTVLDPFLGSGTTALVARRLGRKSIGIELSPEYADLCASRLQQLSLLANA